MGLGRWAAWLGGVAIGWLNLLFSHCLSASTQLCELVFGDLGYFFPTVAGPPPWWQSANSQTIREYDPLPPTYSLPADCWETICCMVVLSNRPSTAFSGNANKRPLNWVQSLILKWKQCLCPVGGQQCFLCFQKDEIKMFQRAFAPQYHN